jgi:integrase
MRRSEVVGKDWIIPQERYKTGLELVIPLSPAAQAVLAALPKIGKGAFDAKVLGELRKENPEAELPRWTLHDLRRTARSLMSRAGVPSDHAERCLGHVLPGIRGTYDRHEYLAEKRQAFDALASLIARIFSPADNVVALSDNRANRAQTADDPSRSLRQPL